ncbi:patatin-like phospholipase family protein [Pseudalkalibacillus caeni]|uniref:PNPLA domain-containing protein n=1 Tax=Exobacillus caeni TaxID=2574798 RepID=A0A5R9EYU8_9BACL|nr:patatin-like phospholipase family protein [Pseudalkalibacillus caeni]TLS36357.1 hypothetical protein FCL54_15620 [Pseudalkalibacillus caeni]
MYIDGVFSGGGVKAIALVGALEAVEKRGLRFKRAAGTSAGALIAALVMAGYKSEDLKGILTTTDLKQLLDQKKKLPFPMFKWLMLYWNLGLYSGKELERWVKQLLKAKGIETFADLPDGSLRIIASDISSGRLIVLPDDLKNYGLVPERFSVARAIRMSASLPYFFQPIPLYTIGGEKHYIVDGGMLSNFPLWVFEPEGAVAKRPVLGFQLSSNFGEMPARKIKNAVELYYALFSTMREAHDARYINDQKAAQIVFIPVQQDLTTEFGLNRDAKDSLMRIGKERTEKFLSKWTKTTYKKRIDL